MNPVNNTQKEFFDDFEKRTGMRPITMELAALEASPAVLSQLELQYPIGQTQLWGLFVFCDRHLFFFSHAADYTICGFRPSGEFESQKEQMLDFTCFKECKASLHGGSGFFARLFGPVNQIDLELTLENGKKVMCLLKTTGNASVAAEKINRCFSEMAASHQE